MKKKFPIEVVLSSIYGVLLCEIGEVYKCLNFIFDNSFYTHQLPKAGFQAQPIIESQHPFLKEIDLSKVNPRNWKGVVTDIKNFYPTEIEIEQVGNYDGGMFSDLAEMLNKDPNDKSGDTTAAASSNTDH